MTIFVVGGGAASVAGGALFVLFVGVAYFIPTIVAMVRKAPDPRSVFVVNFFLGWTLIGWVVALSMASRTAPTQPPHINT